MKIAAIICEYNPLHKGHLWQINETKRITGCNFLMCIMSGNFSQRAEPTIMDKYERAKVAIECGADIVINLPTAYSINNAEVFAEASVKIANSFKNVKFLSFGMEQANLTPLIELAKFLNNESEEYKSYLKEFLDSGISFNKSRLKAVTKLIETNQLKPTYKEDFLNLLTSPNNILAVEYVRVLKKLDSKIKPILIKRLGSNYNDKKLSNSLSSATSIRESIRKTGKLKKSKHALPENSYNSLNYYLKNNGLIDIDLLNNLTLYKLKSIPTKELAKIYNVSEGLENRIKSIAIKNKDVNNFIEELKTKRYKTSRLKSIMLNALLNVNSKTVKQIYKINKLPYLKVLAINNNNKKLLKHLQCKSKLILRKQDVDTLKQTSYIKELMELENLSNDIYNMLIGKNLLASNDIYTITQKIN